MIVEVVAVGTELLMGQIVNSNGSEIGMRIGENGFDAHYQVVVGDNLGRLTATLLQALSRSDAVVITGGIGPTQDDLTREAICQIAGVRMTRDEKHAEWIERRVLAQRPTMASNVFRMADLPEGAEGMPNTNGVALGVAMEIGGKWLFAVPGVPAEMRAMLDNEVLPRLRAIDRQPAVLRSRVIHTWGHGESTVADLLEDLYESANPSVAFLIRDMEVRVRITAKAATDEQAMALIEPFEETIRSRLGAAVFAADDETVEDIVLRDLSERDWSVATIEAATLGQIGARLATVDSTGRFGGTVITGTGPAIRPAANVVLEVGAIGRDRAEDSRTTRPVDFAVQTPELAFRRTLQFGGNDERVRSFAVIAGLHLIRLALQGHDGNEQGP